MQQLGSHWRDFHEIWYVSNFLRKSVEKIQVSLKSHKNNRYFTCRPIHIFIISRSLLLRMTNVADKICREYQNTYFVFCNFFPENRAFYEIMWKTLVERGKPQMAIWRMRITCWIPKDTNTNSGWVIIIVSPLQQWLHERASILRYTYSACLVEDVGVCSW